MRRPSKTRIVNYAFYGRFDLARVEPVLAAAQRTGVLVQFVAKHYAIEDVVWFEGPPGPAMRTLRRAVLATATQPPRRVPA